MIRTLVTIEVTHAKPLADLAERVAARTWSMDGVATAFVVEPEPVATRQDLVNGRLDRDCEACQ